MNLKELRKKLEEQRKNLLNELFFNESIYHPTVITQMVYGIRNTEKVLKMLDE